MTKGFPNPTIGAVTKSPQPELNSGREDQSGCTTGLRLLGQQITEPGKSRDYNPELAHAKVLINQFSV